MIEAVYEGMRSRSGLCGTGRRSNGAMSNT
jgi:hypothetical protein